MQFLGACAGEKCTPPPGSRITKTGQKFLAMVEHTSSFAQLPVPSMLAHHHVDVVSKSMKGVFSEACSWYVATISRSLAKWSLKAVVTLSVQDVPTVLGGISTPQARTGLTGFGQVMDLKQRLLVSLVPSNTSSVSPYSYISLICTHIIDGCHHVRICTC